MHPLQPSNEGLHKWKLNLFIIVPGKEIQVYKLRNGPFKLRSYPHYS